MSAHRTADHLELGLDLLAYGAFIAGERALAEGRVRGQINAHNAGVAAVRAQRARERAARDALGQQLLAGWLADRERLQ